MSLKSQIIDCLKELEEQFPGDKDFKDMKRVAESLPENIEGKLILENAVNKKLQNISYSQKKICGKCDSFTQRREDSGKLSSICKDSEALKNYFEPCCRERS